MGQTTTAVSQHLANGAVGVGENHEDQKARSVVLKVIAQGLVTNLFLELYQVTYGATIQAAQNQIHQGAQGAQLMLGTVDSGASSRGHAPNAIPLSDRKQLCKATLRFTAPTADSATIKMAARLRE